MQREVTRSPGDPEIRGGLASPLSQVMGQVAPGAGREEPLPLPLPGWTRGLPSSGFSRAPRPA